VAVARTRAHRNLRRHGYGIVQSVDASTMEPPQMPDVVLQKSWKDKCSTPRPADSSLCAQEMQFQEDNGGQFESFDATLCTMQERGTP